MTLLCANGRVINGACHENLLREDEDIEENIVR